jgi:hypothetical protein
MVLRNLRLYRPERLFGQPQEILLAFRRVQLALQDRRALQGLQVLQEQPAQLQVQQALKV